MYFSEFKYGQDKYARVRRIIRNLVPEIQMYNSLIHGYLYSTRFSNIVHSSISLENIVFYYRSGLKMRIKTITLIRASQDHEDAIEVYSTLRKETKYIKSYTLSYLFRDVSNERREILRQKNL